MATFLPIPLKFRLPAGWKGAVPEEVGAPDAAFVAVHPGSTIPGFTANITIDGERLDKSTSLIEIANESIGRLQQVSQSVSLSKRSEFGTAETPGVNQILYVRKSIGNNIQSLIQSQIYIYLPDTKNPETHALIRIAFTATSQQFPSLVNDFQWFVDTVEPDTGN